MKLNNYFFGALITIGIFGSILYGFDQSIVQARQDAAFNYVINHDPDYDTTDYVERDAEEICKSMRIDEIPHQYVDEIDPVLIQSCKLLAR